MKLSEWKSETYSTSWVYSIFHLTFLSDYSGSNNNFTAMHSFDLTVREKLAVLDTDKSWKYLLLKEAYSITPD